MKIIGRGGQDLHQSWKGGAEAYLGMTIAGFPNFFMLYGPNTNLVHNSVVYMIECQVRYVTACLTRLERDEIHTLEIKTEIQDRFNARIQQHLQKAMWSRGCTSWYLTDRRAFLDCMDRFDDADIADDIERARGKLLHQPRGSRHVDKVERPTGKNTANWPGYSLTFRLKTHAPKWDDYAVQ